VCFVASLLVAAAASAAPTQETQEPVEPAAVVAVAILIHTEAMRPDSVAEAAVVR
jgi:hypothetical protein